MSRHLKRQIPGQTLGSRVPIQNAALAIDYVDALFELIEQRFMQAGIPQRLRHNVAIRAWARF